VVALKSFLLGRMPVYVGFYDAGGAPIGYRRAIANRDVTDATAPGAGLVAYDIECRTGFGDGAGTTAASCALVFMAAPADPARPGKLWLEPDEIAFPAGRSEAELTIGSVSADFLFRETVRQRATLTLVI